MSLFSDATYLTSANYSRQFVADSGTGRSNAGKSSAINRITGRKALARTSKTPGRTQLVNFFGLGEDARLVDLPGYGFAKVPESMRRHWRTLMESYFSGRRSLVGLFIVMDCRQMIDWAEAAGCPVHVLLTKADKLSRGKAATALHGARRELGPVASVQLFSALKGTGLDEARRALADMLGL